MDVLEDQGCWHPLVAGEATAVEHERGDVDPPRLASASLTQCLCKRKVSASVAWRCSGKEEGRLGGGG